MDLAQRRQQLRQKQVEKVKKFRQSNQSSSDATEKQRDREQMKKEIKQELSQESINIENSDGVTFARVMDIVGPTQMKPLVSGGLWKGTEQISEKMEEELDTRMMMTELIGSLAVVYFAARLGMGDMPTMYGAMAAGLVVAVMMMTFSGARELTGVDAMKDLKARRLIGAEEPMWKAYGAKIVGLKTSEVYTALQTGMIDTINTPPQSIRAYSWWEFLKFGQRPYQYFADAYIMANSDWFGKLPSDLQQVVLDAGKKFGDVSTSKIIGVGEEVISEFEARGGKMTVLAGAEKDKFDKLMSEKVLPAMMDKFDADALKAAEAFVAN